MSRSHPSPSRSRRSSTRRDHNLSITQAAFQDFNLHETAGSQPLSLPLAYQTSDLRYDRPSYPQSEPGASYLESGYDPSIYIPTSSPERFINPQRTSPLSTFGIPDPDPLGYPIDPDTVNFGIPQNISDPTLLSRPDMRYDNKSFSKIHSVIDICHKVASPSSQTHWPATIVNKLRLTRDRHQCAVCSHLSWVTSQQSHSRLQTTRILTRKTRNAVVRLVPLALTSCQARPLARLAPWSLRLLGIGGELYKNLAASPKLA